MVLGGTRSAKGFYACIYLKSGDLVGCYPCLTHTHTQTTDESVTHLRYHIKRVHSSMKDLQCDECDYKASVNTNLIRHKRRNHDPVKTKCTSCNFIGTQAALFDHMRNIHGDMKQCNDCDYKARLTSSMVQHQRAKHQGVSFHCGECDSKFESEAGLKLQTDNKHRGIRFKCAQCELTNCNNHLKGKTEAFF